MKNVDDVMVVMDNLFRKKKEEINNYKTPEGISPLAPFGEGGIGFCSLYTLIDCLNILCKQIISLVHISPGRCPARPVDISHCFFEQ